MGRTSLRLGLAVVACILSVAGVSAQERELADTYLSYLQDVWSENASASDVERLTSLLSEDVVYVHNRVGARMEGRHVIADAMTSFLGSSRLPRISLLQTTVAPGVVVFGFDLQMELKQGDGWTTLKRRQVIVIEIVDGEIVRISDHW